MKKLIYIILGIVLLGSSITSLIFVLKANIFSSHITRLRQMSQKIEEDLIAVRSEREKIAKENERLQADALSYMAINTRLQQEKEKIQKGLDDAQKIIRTKEADLERTKQRLEKAEKLSTKEILGQDKAESSEKEKLEKELAALENKLSAEKAVYYYNLAVAYTRAKLYGEAISAYEESLKLKKENPEAHYNLGLLYENVKDYPDRATVHYRAYLMQKPDAPDREEVAGWIENLKRP